MKENNKRVIGCGAKRSTSDLLVGNSDEFIYYDDLIRVAKKTQAKDHAKPKEGPPKEADAKEDKKQEAVDRVLEVLNSVEQDYDPLWGSLLKQAIRRVFPGFNEGYYGYGSFSDLLEDLQSRGLIELEHDDARGNYKVRRARAERRTKPKGRPLQIKGDGLSDRLPASDAQHLALNTRPRRRRRRGRKPEHQEHTPDNREHSRSWTLQSVARTVACP